MPTIGNIARTAETLPTEILLGIFDYLHYNATLSFPTVCKAWYNVATFLLYKNVIIRNQDVIAKFVCTLNTSSLGAVVVSLTIGGTLRENAHRPLQLRLWPAYDGRWGWDVVVKTVLSKCANLRNFHFDLLYGASVARLPSMGSIDIARAVARLHCLEISEPISQDLIRKDISPRPNRQLQPSHWLVDAMSTRESNLHIPTFPNLTNLTLKRSRRLVSNNFWVAFPALSTLRLCELDISFTSLRALLSATPCLETLEFCNVRVSRQLHNTQEQRLASVSLPRLTSLTMDVDLHPSDIFTLFTACASTLEVLNLKGTRTFGLLPPSSDPVKFTRLRTVTINGYLTAATVLIQHVAHRLRTLEITGWIQPWSAREKQYDPAALNILSPLHNTLVELTLRNFDFRQRNLAEFLPNLSTLQTLTVHTGAQSLLMTFYHTLPINLRHFRVLGNMTRGQFDALHYSVSSSDKISLRYPLLKVFEVASDTAEWNVERQKLLRQACQEHDIALRVRLWIEP